MRGRIVKVNYQRGLAAFEDNIGDYGYFEILGSDNLETDDIIEGDLHSLGTEVIIKPETGERFDVFIEDWGMTLKGAQEKVFPD